MVAGRKQSKRKKTGGVLEDKTLSLFLPDKEGVPISLLLGQGNGTLLNGCGEEKTRLATVCGFLAALIDMDQEEDAPEQHMRIFRDKANLLGGPWKGGNNVQVDMCDCPDSFSTACYFYKIQILSPKYFPIQKSSKHLISPDIFQYKEPSAVISCSRSVV